MDTRRILSIIWKWLWLIVLTTGLAAGISYYTVSRAPKTFMATTTLLVGLSLQNPNPNATDLFTSQQLAQTYILLAKTNPVLQGVIDAFGLAMTPEQLRWNVSATMIQGTQLIEIRVTSHDPVLAQAIANEVAHQMILQTPSAKDEVGSIRRDFIQKQVDDLQNRLEDTQKKIDELQKSISVNAGAREIADKQQQIASLQGQMNQWQMTYATLITSLGQRGSNYLSVFEPARLPTRPVGSDLEANVLLASAIGMLLATTAAFVIEFIDDTVRSPDDASQSLMLPSLGNIADIWGERPEDKLIAARYPRSSHAEAYRILRANIEVADPDKPIRTLLISSPNPDEGKSITASNLAVVMAQTGQRVILVDADLRRPWQHKCFNSQNTLGLSNALLQSDDSQNGFFQPTETDNLVVLTSGPLPPNPAELLGGNRMRMLIEHLKQEFDMVIVDSPPILLRADSAILARQVDAVLLVLDMGRTRRDSAIRAKQVLERAGGNILGIVLNRVKPQSDGYYAYYYYSDERGEKKRSRFANSSLARSLRQRLWRPGGIK
jgi:non-specific protein-tyrosine kinase